MKHASGLKVLASALLLLSIAASPVLASPSQTAKGKQEVLYPDTKRVAPKLDLTSTKDQKTVNEGLDAVANDDKDKALQLLQPVADGGSSSKYAQALALQGLATLKYKDNDFKGAIELLNKSLALGVMPNDTYFQLMYELAQFQMGDEQYQPAIDTLTKWRAEGRKETAESYALEGNADYRLGKYAEAIAAITKAKSLTDKPQDSWNQILMASYSESGQTDKASQLAVQLASSSSDPNALNNAVAVLQQAGKYPEAIQLMEKARSSGQLTSETTYVNLAKLYLISGQSSDNPKPNALKAMQVIEEGMGKGIIEDNAENQMLLGQAAEMADNVDKAVAAYTKASASASNGEAAMRAGNLLITEEKFTQAKGLIQKSISKGVKHPGTAYMLLAQCEIGLKNKPAAIAAMKMAAQQPETAERAKAWLKTATTGKKSG